MGFYCSSLIALVHWSGILVQARCLWTSYKERIMDWMYWFFLTCLLVNMLAWFLGTCWHHICWRDVQCDSHVFDTLFLCHSSAMYMSLSYIFTQVLWRFVCFCSVVWTNSNEPCIYAIRPFPAWEYCLELCLALSFFCLTKWPSVIDFWSHGSQWPAAAQLSNAALALCALWPLDS